MARFWIAHGIAPQHKAVGVAHQRIGFVRRIFIALGLAVVISSGLMSCSASSNLNDDEQISTADLDYLLDEQLRSYRDGVFALFPDAELPDVTIVRKVTPDESARVVATCLTDLGFPAEPQADGGIKHSEINAAQEEAMFVAMYECRSRYPTDPVYLQPLTDSQTESLYRYFVGTLTECVESFGVAVSETPSLTRFAETLGTPDMWSPYQFVDGSAEARTDDILRQCPQLPAEWR